MSDVLTPGFGGRSLKSLFERYLGEFYSVFLRVSYQPEVAVPEHLKSEQWKRGFTTITLEYGLNLPKPICDLTITDTGVLATLSFDNVSFLTSIPWSAVHAIAGRDPRKKTTSSKPALKLV
jgi:hypothetical protein